METLYIWCCTVTSLVYGGFVIYVIGLFSTDKKNCHQENNHVIVLQFQQQTENKSGNVQ